MNKYKYAFIIAASENYLEGLKALLNSIDAHHDDVEIVLLSFRLPTEFLESLPAEGYKVIEVDGPEQVHMTAIERFRVASEVCEDYEAICLMDADMFLVENTSLFFEVASKGFIVTGSNGMVVNFNRAYQDKYDLDLGSDDYVYTKVHTTVPIFINQDNVDWFRALYNARRIDSWDDFLYLNLIGAQMGKDKKMLCLPPYTFTGIHHFQMKVETGLVEKGGKILTGTEEQAYMVHGKWWDEAWLQDLMPTMSKYHKDHDMGSKCVQMTENSIKLIKELFKHYRGLK